MAATLRGALSAAAPMLPAQRRPGCAPSTSASSSPSSSFSARLPMRAAAPVPPRAMAGRHHHHHDQQPWAPTLAGTTAAAAAAAGGARRARHRRAPPSPVVAAAAGASSAAGPWPSPGANNPLDKAPDSSAVPTDLPPAPEGLDQPFPRRHERDPRRLLGVDPDASFDEVQDARNYLSERYRLHAPSREAIELAFDALLQEHLQDRSRFGFRPPATGMSRRGRGVFGAGVGSGGGKAASASSSGLSALLSKFRSLWDPTVTTRTIINEGSVFAALAVWALFAGEQSFPTVAAVAYCIYQFKTKRVKRDPEGPFFVNSPTAGAVLSTACCMAVAVGLGTGLEPVVVSVMNGVVGQAQAKAFVTIAALGSLGVALK
jgi:hypothetical protein